jgi:hypothetical protein
MAMLVILFPRVQIGGVQAKEPALFCGTDSFFANGCNESDRLFFRDHRIPCHWSWRYDFTHPFDKSLTDRNLTPEPFINEPTIGIGAL